MKQPDELKSQGPARGVGELTAEADARRERLADNLNTLSVRLMPGNLVQDAKDRAWAEVDRMTDEALHIASDLLADIGAWARANSRWLAGGTVAALLAGAVLWYSTRRKPVPLFEAYDQEEFEMTETDETLSARATGAWNRVKDDARHLGDKAGEAYYSARSRAAEVSVEARERAAHAAEVARERAHEAAEAAREAAEKARIAAGEAGEWARRQPQESPATVVLAALAAGALLGALLPARGGNRRG